MKMHRLCAETLRNEKKKKREKKNKINTGNKESSQERDKERK